MVAHYKRSDYNMSDRDVQKMLRSLLFNGALLKTAFLKCIDAFQPEHIINYSGDHIYYRIAFELSRQRGIDVLTHERGQLTGTYSLLNNVTNSSAWSDGIQEWEDWRNAPLSRKQFSEVQSYISGMEQGNCNNFVKLYHCQANYESLKKELRIPYSAKVIALFTSNEWELGSFKAIAGKRLIFEDQIEWMRQTAQICAKNNWYLVIRHHPIIAGTAEYPRDTDFLQKILKLDSEFGSHVRMIMPADRITSYALVWNADAAVTIYSTVGMESFIRGVGAVHLSDTIYKPMGLDVVVRLEDYEPAIRAAIERTKQFTIEQLRKAYRFAHFRFFIAYSHMFQSFGIKDIYYPDLRIRHLDELAQGNDPVLDRVCAHIVGGSPLYPLPDPVAEQDNRLVEESDCLRTEMETIKRRKAGIEKYLSEKADFPDPRVTIIRIRQNGIRNTGSEFLTRSISRSWHKNFEYIQTPLTSSTDVQWFMASLRDMIARSGSDFFYIASDNVQIHGSFISTCVDYLSAPQNADKGVVGCGSYICGTGGELRDEVLTAQKPSRSFDAITQASSSFQNPATLLSLFFFRKKFIIEILSRSLHQTGDMSLAELSCLLFDSISEQPSRLHEVHIPMLTVHENPTATQILKHALAGIRNGDTQKSLEMLDQLRITEALTPELQYARAVSKSQLGRFLETRLAIESILSTFQVSDAIWRFYDTILLELLQAPNGYDTIAQAVDSIDGYLVPGQEQYLFNKVRSLSNDAAILEIGGYFGKSTAAMAFACAGTKRHIVSIDTFCGNDGPMGRSEDFQDVWYANLKRFDLERYVTPLKGLSHQVLSTLENGPQFDFAFIDGSHEYADILKDLELIYPLVKDGGWIALHDVEAGWPGPWRVWRQTARRLLTDHDYQSTLACGRKEKHKSFKTYDEMRYSYAVDWADYLGSCSPKLAALTNAMRATATLLAKSPIIPQHLEPELKHASSILAYMPEQLKQIMRIMLTKEAGTDWLLHYWNGLTLHQEGNVEAAAREFQEAHKRYSPVDGLC